MITQIDTSSFHLNHPFSTRSDQKSVRPRATTLIIPQDNVEMDFSNIKTCWSGYNRYPISFHSQDIPILFERDE